MQVLPAAMRRQRGTRHSLHVATHCQFLSDERSCSWFLTHTSFLQVHPLTALGWVAASHKVLVRYAVLQTSSRCSVETLCIASGTLHATYESKLAAVQPPVPAAPRPPQRLQLLQLPSPLAALPQVCGLAAGRAALLRLHGCRPLLLKFSL